MSTLEDFGLLSSYKLNVRKTQVLTLNYVPDQATRERFKLNWDSKINEIFGSESTSRLMSTEIYKL